MLFEQFLGERNLRSVRIDRLLGEIIADGKRHFFEFGRIETDFRGQVTTFTDQLGQPFFVESGEIAGAVIGNGEGFALRIVWGEIHALDGNQLGTVRFDNPDRNTEFFGLFQHSVSGNGGVSSIDQD